MNDLHIVTVATESKYYFPYLVESCKRHGKEIELLGYGEKWRGFNSKYSMMIDYLKTLPENHIVCFVDGYDVLCVRNLNDLKTEFIRVQKETNCKIVVAGSDKNNSQNLFDYIVVTLCEQSFAFGKCKDQPLNSGTYIGYAKDLLHILKTIYDANPDDTYDDQVLLTQHCTRNEREFYIDTKTEFFSVWFYPLHNIDHLIKIENNVVYVNDSKPFFIHAVSGTYLDNIIIQLGYTYDNTHKIKDYIYAHYVTDKLYKSLLSKYVLVFFFIVCVIIVVVIGVKQKRFWMKRFRTNILK